MSAGERGRPKIEQKLSKKDNDINLISKEFKVDFHVA